jgi:hypothetical protein
MKNVLALIVSLLLALGLASNAEAAAAEAEPAWNSLAGAEQAANVMGVSTAQAAEDLAVQHNALDWTLPHRGGASRSPSVVATGNYNVMARLVGSGISYWLSRECH